MIELVGRVAQGHLTADELREGLRRFAGEIGAQSSELTRIELGGEEEPLWVEDCPARCTVCAEAKPQFEDIKADATVQRERLKDPANYPYAVGKHTLHQSGCKMAQAAAGTPWDDMPGRVASDMEASGLRQFAHKGYRNTGWSAQMQVMTAQEAARWTRDRTGPRGGTQYKVCRVCRPPTP